MTTLRFQRAGDGYPKKAVCNGAAEAAAIAELLRSLGYEVWMV